MLRGFDDEFWRPLEQIRESLLDGEELRLPSRILREGPCPGTARVYFALTLAPDYGNPDEIIVSLLGVEIKKSKKEAGRVLDGWIDKANEDSNQVLTGQRNCICSNGILPLNMEQFYNERLRTAKELAERSSIPFGGLEMEIKPVFESDEFPFTESEPDGMWRQLDGEFPGGIFETKLTVPPEPASGMILAGYAIIAECFCQHPFDVGVILSVGLGRNDLLVESQRITAGLRDSVRQNIEKLVSLLALSVMGGNWNPSARRWIDKLYRPTTPQHSPVCDSCPYRVVCRESQ